MNVRKKKSRLEQIGLSVASETKQRIKDLSEQTNITEDTLKRMAIKKFLDDGCNEPLLLTSLIQLASDIKDLEREIPEEKYISLQQSLGNIMTIKGGK